MTSSPCFINCEIKCLSLLSSPPEWFLLINHASWRHTIIMYMYLICYDLNLFVNEKLGIKYLETIKCSLWKINYILFVLCLSAHVLLMTFLIYFCYCNVSLIIINSFVIVYFCYIFRFEPLVNIILYSIFNKLYVILGSVIHVNLLKDLHWYRICNMILNHDTVFLFIFSSVVFLWL